MTAMTEKNAARPEYIREEMVLVAIVYGFQW
jgi:hypothetical protein